MAKEVVLVAKEKYMQLLRSHERISDNGNKEAEENAPSTSSNDTSIPRKIEHDTSPEETTQRGGGQDISNESESNASTGENYVNFTPDQFANNFHRSRKRNSPSRKKSKVQWVEFSI